MTLLEHTSTGPDLAPLNDLIPQRFWTGTSHHAPEVYEVDCSDFEMNDADLRPGSELTRRMRATFDSVGLVVLRNTRLTSVAAMREFSKIVLDVEMVYEGGANPRDRIEANVYEIGAPLAARLPFHHEMAYVSKSTQLISFVCADALPDRGATYVSDGVASTDAILATELGQKLKAHGVCYHRSLTDAENFVGEIGYGVYNHWQKSFGTDDPAIAEAKAIERGLLVEWGPNRLMKTRFYNPAFEYFAQLDRNLLYASLADHGMWFDTWPLVQHLPFAERPLHMTFGDDTEFTRDELEQFIKIYDDFGTKVDWRQGDVAVICNYRFAHGRPEIHLGSGEQRTLGVMLGEQFDRIGQLPGKW
ncbi:TauD/TfdA family dioxygenase [uncultured Ilumatobacter sp.]|uniref:TauD/TfdA family dioxygenase n=1 Tax=uncultured Ilumatobacter sp. TaxID=879968 RepID=UPI00374FAF3E